MAIRSGFDIAFIIKKTEIVFMLTVVVAFSSVVKNELFF